MNTSTRALCDADPAAISIEEARERIRLAIRPVTQTEVLPLTEALGRTTAKSITSPLSIPPFRASAMDGFAVRSSDCDLSLLVQNASYAGHPGPDELPAGTAQRITTGARVPDAADAVVQIENVERQGDSITVRAIPNVGQNIRMLGSDTQAGEGLIEADTEMGSAEIALLSAHGIASVTVYRPIRIALFSTGDELCNPGTALKPGAIYDANRPLLQAMLASNSVEIHDLGICGDSMQALQSLLDQLTDVDVVVSSGGVSVGDADYVRPVLESRGEIDLWKVAMKPGRPLTFGRCGADQLYFGLPGNPVSAALTCLLFVRPALAYLQGRDWQLPPPIMLPLSGTLKKLPGRVEYQRAVVKKNANQQWSVEASGVQDSHVLSALQRANCLVELPLESSGAQAGELVAVYPFQHFGSSKI